MLRGSPQLKKFVVGRSRGVDEQLAAEGERAEFVFEAEAFQLEGSANRQGDVIALGPQRPRGRFRQAGVGLQGFVKHLHLPPFFVGRGDGVIVARQVAAHQMQGKRI